MTTKREDEAPGQIWCLGALELLAKRARPEELPGLRRAYKFIRDELTRRGVVDDE